MKKPTRFDFSVRHYLIIGRPEGHLWGIGKEKSIIPCSEQAIEGILLGFQINIKEDSTYGGSRLLIFLQDTETTEVDCISSGFQNKAKEFTCFAKSFCLSLDKGFDATKPIIIVPTKTDDPDSKPVFCNIYQQEKVKYEWNPDVDCLKILQEFSPSFPDVPLYFTKEDKTDSTSSASIQANVPKYHTAEGLNSGFNYSLEKSESQSTIGVTREEVDFQLLINQQNGWIQKLGWNKQKCFDFLITNYGKKSRQLLSDVEFLEFHNYLKNLAEPPQEVNMDDIPF